MDDSPCATYRVPWSEVEHLFTPRLEGGELTDENAFDLEMPEQFTLAAVAQRIARDELASRAYKVHVDTCRGLCRRNCPQCGKGA